MPQFNGTVRVNARGLESPGAVGHATRDVIVRDPVVISASLPQFLAPGDRSQILVELANTDGPEGDYAVELFTASGKGSGRQPALRSTLSCRRRARQPRRCRWRGFRAAPIR